MQTISLDISNKQEVSPIFMKQGDVGRQFQAVITNNGAPYTLPAGGVVTGWYSGTSGSGNYSGISGRNPFSWQGNTLTVELVAQMAVNYGGGIFCLVINDNTGTQLGLWNIPYYVEKIPGSDSQEATAYYSAFSEAASRWIPDTSLTVPGKPADACATRIALNTRAAKTLTVELGSAISLAGLSSMVLEQLQQMASTEARFITILCDFEVYGSALLILHKSRGIDGTMEGAIELIGSDGSFMVGSTYSENAGADWADISWNTVFTQENPPVASQVGAAPSGYGWGDTQGRQLDGTVSLNDVCRTGCYYWSGVTPSGSPCGNMGYMDVLSPEYAVIRQTVRTAAGDTQCEVTRTRKDGTWGEWEWINPPLAIGVEYRTTERYNGKAVYTKLMDFGAIPAVGSQKLVPALEENGTVFICSAYSSQRGITYPAYLPGGVIIGVDSVANNVRVTNYMENKSDTTLRVHIKYTKE